MAAFLWFGGQRRKREKAEALSINTMAARGEARDLKKMHKDLMREV